MFQIQLTDMEVDDWFITLTFHASPVRKQQFTLDLRDISEAKFIAGTSYFKIKTHSRKLWVADRSCWLGLKECLERANLPCRFTLGGIYVG